MPLDDPTVNPEEETQQEQAAGQNYTPDPTDTEEVEDENPLESIYGSQQEEAGISDDDEFDFDYGAKDITDEQLDEAEDKNVVGQNLLDVDTDVDEEIEANQTAGEMLGRAVFGGVYKGVNTIFENAGYLGDIITPDFMNFSNSMEEGYTNWLSEWAAENKEEYDKSNKIYGDSGFAQVMQGLQGLVDSTVGFAATGAGVGALVGKGAQLLNGMIKAGFMTEAMVARVGTAVATNYAESAMMGAELHKNVMQSALRNGVSAKDAVKIADARAKQFIWENKVNVVSDVFALRSMSKGGNIITGAMNKTRKQKIVGGVIDAFSEGAEEVIGGSLQKRGERKADIDMGVILDDNTTFVGRGIDYATSKEGLKEGLMGMFGGPFQSMAVGGTSKLIKKATEKITGRPTAVNDPGEFKDEAPTFDMEAPRPIGKKPLTTAEKYLKNNAASASKEEAESYTTDEERAADEKEMEDWLSSGKRRKSAQDYIAAEEKYNKELEVYEQRKKDHEIEKKKYEEYTYETKLGSKAQAKEDVEKFLTNDASLRRQYNKAFIDGDKSKAEDIEKDRFESLFVRYADRGMTDGLSDQLNEIMEDPESTAEMKKYATTYKEKIKGYQKDYMKEYDKHGRKKGNQMFKLKRRIDSTKEAIADLNKEMDLSSMKLASELLNTDGKIASPIQVEIIGLQAEQRQLEQMKRKLSVVDNSVLKVEFEKKEKAIEDRIKKLTKDIGDEKLSNKDITGLDSYKEFESKAQQRSDAWLAHQGYKKSYEWQSSPKMAIAIRKQNFNHLMKEVEENTFNDNDVAINLALSRELDLSDKQKAAFHQAIDLTAKNLKIKRDIDLKDYKKLLQNKKDYDRVSKSIEQSTLDAIDEIKLRKRNDYSVQDQNIEKARRAYLDDQAKAHQMQYESIFERDRVNLKAYHQKNADRNFNLYKKAQWEKVAFIRQNEDKLAAAYNRVKDNQVKKIRIDALKEKTKTRLETNQAHIDATAFAFNEKSFMAKMERRLAEELANEEEVKLNRSDIVEEEGPEAGPEQKFNAKTPSNVNRDLDTEKREGSTKKHNSKWEKVSTTEIMKTIEELKGKREIEGTPAEKTRVNLIDELEGQLDSRKNGNGKDGYAEYGLSTEIGGNVKGRIAGRTADGEGDPGPGPDEWRDWNQGSGQQGFDPYSNTEDPIVLDTQEDPNYTDVNQINAGQLNPVDPTQNGPTPIELQQGNDPQFGDGPPSGPEMEFNPNPGQVGEGPESGPVMEFHSEPGDKAPKNTGKITPTEYQSGVQVVQDTNADDDNKELSTALSHLATIKKEQNPTSNKDIAPNDHDKPEHKPPVSEEFNEKNRELNEDWPWSVSYVSYSDGVGQKNNSGLTDWVETTDFDKRTSASGHTIRYEFSPTDANLDVEDIEAIKESIEKYKNGEELNEADISRLPIRMVVYRKDGKPLIQNGNKVYGWMKTATYFSGTEMESVLEARKQIIQAFIEGDTFETRIEKVSPGMLKSEDENSNTEDQRKNPANYLGKNLKLVVSDGISLVDQDKSDDGDLNHPHTNRGFVFLKTKDANGRFFPLKLNSRRLEEQEVDAIIQILKNYGLHGQDANSDSTLGTVSGLKNKEIMDLLIFTGSKSNITAYPFNVDNSKGTLLFGEKTIQLKDLKDAGVVLEVSKYLSTMWRTTNIPMMNGLMNKTFNNDFNWFGTDIQVSKISYNDFLFNDEALSTNASFHNGRLFIQPAVITSKPEHWNKVSGKKGVESEDNAKAIQDKKDVDELNKLITPLENLLVPIKLSWNPSQGYKVIDANSDPQKVLLQSKEVKEILRFAKNRITKNNEILAKQKRQTALKSIKNTPAVIKKTTPPTEGVQSYDEILDILKIDGVSVTDAQKAKIKKAFDNNGSITSFSNTPTDSSYVVIGENGVITESTDSMSEAVADLVEYNMPTTSTPTNVNVGFSRPDANLSINEEIKNLEIKKKKQIDDVKDEFLSPEVEAEIIGDIEFEIERLKQEVYYQDDLSLEEEQRGIQQITEAEEIKQEALDIINRQEDKLNNNQKVIRSLYDELNSLPQKSERRNTVLARIENLERKKLSRTEEQIAKAEIEAAKSRLMKAEAIISDATSTADTTTETNEVKEVTYKGIKYSVDFSEGTITNFKTGNVLKGGVTSPTGLAIVDQAIAEQEANTTDTTAVVSKTSTKGNGRISITKEGVKVDLKVDMVTGVVYEGKNFKKKVIDFEKTNLAHIKSGFLQFTPVEIPNVVSNKFAIVYDNKATNGVKVINLNEGQYMGSIATANQQKAVFKAANQKTKPSAVQTKVAPVPEINTQSFVSKDPEMVIAPGSAAVEVSDKQADDNKAGEGVGASLGIKPKNETQKQKAQKVEKVPTTTTDNLFTIPTKRGLGKNKKGKDTDFTKNPKNPNDPTSPKYSMMTETLTKVNAKKEREILQKMLPNVPVNIIEGLIGTATGGFAEGSFYEGVVSISDVGNKGVAYHEGFHAVVSGYLTNVERDNLFKEARKRFGKNESDYEIEELLAEEFRAYMIQNGEMKVPSTFKWLYDMLKDLINLFRGKHKSLFSKIRDGRFDYMPPYAHSEKIAYSELAGNINSAMKRETIDALTYRVVKFSGVRSMDTASRMYESIDEILEDVRDSIIDDMIDAAEAKNVELYNNFNTITTEIEGQKDNWPAYSQLVKDELTSLNLKFTQNDSTKSEDALLNGQEEEINEALNIKSALLFSGKDNASNNTKMMVKMIKDPNAKSAFFGPGFERLANYDTSWRILENTLAGMSNTAASSQVEKMNDSLDILAVTHPEFNEIIGQLKETDETIVPDYKKIQFYRAFSKQHVLFNHSQIKKVDGDFTWMIGNADSQSHAALLKKEWSETFKNRFTEGGNITNDGLAKMQEIVRKAKNFSLIIEEIRKGKYPSKNPYKQLADILQETGIGVSEQTIKAYALAQPGKSEAIKLVKMYTRRIEPMLLNTRNNRGINFELMSDSNEYLYDDENSFITDYNQTIGPLAVNEGFQKKETLENMVMGPEGNLYWTKSLNNNITKTISQWKSDPAEIDRLLNSEYHKKSKYLAYFAGYEFNRDEEGEMFTTEDQEGLQKKSRERLEQFEAEVFLSNRMDDGQDKGTAYNKMTDVDGAIDSLNKTLFGLNNSNKIGSTLSPLTFADKSTFYMFSGIPIETFKCPEHETGASDKAVNTMYQYFTAEAERLNSSNINKTGNSFFDNKGSKEFHWFPELSPGTALSKQMNLFTESVDKTTNEIIYTTNLTDPKVTRLVKKHIGEAIYDRIYEQKELLTEQTIIKQDEKNNYTIEGVDAGIISYYRRQISATEGDTKQEKESNQMNEIIDHIVSDYVLNSMISNIEYTMMFAGDPAFYKDLSKRTPSAIATGIDLINLGDEPLNYTVSVTNDVKEKSSLYDEYLTEFTERGVPNAEAKLKPYLEMEKADAQAYITPKRFRSLMRQLGEWTPEHDAAYARLDKGENVDHKDLLMMQPLKGMHYELVNNGTGFLVPVYLKYSQAPLWPGLVKGTKNENLLKQMELDGIDEVVFNSGVKTGAMETSDMAPVLEGVSKKGHFKPMTLSNYHYKLQQDLPSKYEKTGRTIVGSQVRKNIKANITGRYDKELGGFVPRMFTDKTTGERVDGAEMAKRIDKVESSLSDLGRDEFIKKYDIRNGKIHNTEPIYQNLEAKYKKDKADSNLIGQLGTTGNRPPLDLMFAHKEKIEQELFSELNKATVIGSGSGGSFIQISGSGFTGLTTNRDLGSEFDINSIIPLKDISEFKGPRKGPDGNFAADVMIPFSAVRDIPNYEKLNPEVLKKLLGDTIQDLVGYRIPNQGMSSIDLFNVVGILPPSAGDSMVVYDEITGKTGSDFDIDKMYVMMHETVWNPRTSRLERVSNENIDLVRTKGGKELSLSQAQKMLLENERMTLWASVLESDDSYVDLITPLDAEWLKYEGYYCDLLTSSKENKEDLLEYISNIEDNEGNQIEDYQNLDFDDFRILNNASELAHDFEKQKKGKSLQFASPQEQLSIKSKNVAGQAGVGMTANHLVHFVMMQQIGRSQELNEDGDKITEIMSAWLNAFVDNAKDPFISLLNNNTFTSDTVFFLLREGVSPKKINRLMSSPVIKEYAKQNYISKSKIIGSDEKTKEYFKVMSETGGSHPYTATTLSIKKQYGIKDPLTKTIEKFGLKINNKTPADSSANSSSLKKMTVDQIEEMILNPTNTSQLQMLAMFENFSKSAVSLASIVKAAKFDTKGAGMGNVENYTKDRQINNLGVNLEEPSYWAQSYLEIQDQTFMKEMKENSHDLGRSVYGSLMFSGGPANRGVMSIINGMTKKDGSDLELNKLITKEHYSYIYSGGFRSDKNKMSIKDLFYGKKSTAKKLHKFRELYPNNKLLKVLNTDIADSVKNPSFLLFPSSKKKGREEIEELVGSWKELLDDNTVQNEETGYTTSDFAKELVQMSFASSGFNKTINSFFDLIPYEYMRGDMTDVTSSFNNQTKESMAAVGGNVGFNFIDQFFRHNWLNEEIVPSFNVNSPSLKNISKTLTKTTAGFIVSDAKLPSKMNIGSKKQPSAREYVSLKGVDVIPPMMIEEKYQYLYKHIGKKEGINYYQRISPLGLKDKGKTIKEYDMGKTNMDSEVNPGILRDFDPNTFQLATTIPTQNSGVVEEIKFKGNEEQDFFEVNDIPFDFEVEEVFNNDTGVIEYQVFAYKRDDDNNIDSENGKGFKVYPTKADAFIGTQRDIQNQGIEDLLLSLNNEC